MFNVKDKIALVTGATGGIGGAIAHALHNHGAHVALTGRSNVKRMEELEQELGEHVMVAAVNMLEDGAIDDLVARIEKEVGPVDILVNNAGMTRDNLSMRMKDDEWQQVLDVNLTATFKLARALQRGMMKRRFGRIINITSVVGVTGNAGQCNYAASKAGLIGWSKSMAQELASRGVTVNCVAPGFIDTAMTEVLNDDQKQKLNAAIPMGRMGTSEEIAAAVLFLASEEASYITGQTIHVNGGMAMI